MRCRVCHSPDTKPFTVSGVQLLRCSSCSSAMVGPRHPRSPQKLDSIYSFRDYKQREAQFRRRGDELARFVSQWKKGGKVLDVGAGFGLLSAVFSRRGYQVSSLEPVVEPVYAVRQRGVRIIRKTVEAYGQQTRDRFDLIVLMDVLEHADDPGKLLRLLQNLLHHGGMILVQTPNERSVMRYAVRHWAWWMFEDHRVFLSSQSFEKLAQQAKLRVKVHRTYEDYEDMRKQFEGWFTPVRISVVRKTLKLVVMPLFTLAYLALRPLIWSKRWGGLHLVVLEKG